MSDEATPQRRLLSPRSWEDWVVTTVITIVGTAIYVALVALTAAYGRITVRDAGAFRALLAFAFLGAFLAAASIVVAAHLYRRQSAKYADLVRSIRTLDTHANDRSRELNESIQTLRSEVANFDWTFQAEEHRSAVYRKITSLVCEEPVLRFDIMTIFRTLDALDEKGARALKDYYDSIERQLKDKSGFQYRRAVVIRQEVAGRTGSSSDDEETRRLLQLLKVARPQFVDHFQSIRSSHYKWPTSGEIQLYRDDGRMFDLAFGLSTGRDDSAVSLAIELSVSPTFSRPFAAPTAISRNLTRALALVTIRAPRPEVQAAFAGTFQALYTGKVLPSIPASLIEEEWGRT